jgi:hypothetical protein
LQLDELQTRLTAIEERLNLVEREKDELIKDKERLKKEKKKVVGVQYHVHAHLTLLIVYMGSTVSKNSMKDN